MGSNAHGILWGIEIPDGIDFFGDAEDQDPRWPNGLLHAWETKCEPLILKFEKRYPSKAGTDRFVPDSTTESAPWLLGFWVALARSGKEGIPDLGTVPVYSVSSTKPYNKAVYRAVRRWNRFERWAKKQGLHLLPATLWLTETDVG